MKVSCQACGAKYTIADDKVRGRKVKIRCKSCGTPIVVDGQNASEPAEAGAAAVSVTPPPAVAGASTSWSVNLSDTDSRTMTTQEIVDAWKTGVVTNDAYVWKDGMADWVPILDSELKASLPAPGVLSATPAGGLPAGLAASGAPVAARLAGNRTGAVDLFDATDGGGAGEEDDVATSAPQLPTAGSTAYDDKPTGARNENSVLFSLDSLKSGLANELRKPGKSAPPGPDPFAMSPPNDLLAAGGAPLFSLNANQALLTAPAPPEPPPPRFDASGAPAKPMNKALVFGGAGAAAVVLLLVGLLLGRSGRSDDEAAAEASAKAASADAPDSDKKSTDEKPDEKKPDEKKPDTTPPPATASAAPSAAEPAKVATPSETKPGTGATPGGRATPTKTSEPKKEEPPAVGTSPFSVSAAQVALTQAAGNAGSCSKPAGPSGSGKVQVTFATSGRVTSAVVTDPKFAGTPVGGCVAGVFRRARIPAFAGNPVTVSKSFSVK